MCFQRKAWVLELVEGIVLQAGIDDGFALAMPTFQQDAGGTELAQLACRANEIRFLAQRTAKKDLRLREVGR